MKKPQCHSCAPSSIRRAGVILIVMIAALPPLYSRGRTEGPAPLPIEVSLPGQFPIARDKVTLTAFAVQDPRVIDLATNEYTLSLERKTNVHIRWELVPESSVDEKRRLILASGDFPDIFYGVSLTRDELAAYGGQGSLVRLNDLIDRHGYEITRRLKEYPELRRDLTAPDGGIYSLASINECYHCSMSMKLWIARSWLSNLGQPMPHTTEEFRRTLRQFARGDPNRNGRKDEIPLSGATVNSWWGDPYNFLMNAFIYNDGGARLVVRKGAVSFAADTPAWREGLRYIHGLYAEGLIDPASFTQDPEQLRRLVESPDGVLVGAVGGGWPGVWMTWGGGSGRDTLYDVVPALTGPAGARNAAYFPQDPDLGRFAISSRCRFPEVAFKWGDLRLNLEESVNFNYGLRGTYWDWADPGEVGSTGKPAVWKLLKPLAVPQNATWYMWGDFYYPESWRIGQAVDRGAGFHDPAGLEARLRSETLAKMEPARSSQYYPTVWYTKAALAELAPLSMQIQTYVDESTVRFIVGDLDIEKGWETYLADLRKMGLAHYLEIQQEAYTRWRER